jgi:hypothetical protein
MIASVVNDNDFITRNMALKCSLPALNGADERADRHDTFRASSAAPVSDLSDASSNLNCGRFTDKRYATGNLVKHFIHSPRSNPERQTRWTCKPFQLLNELSTSVKNLLTSVANDNWHPLDVA